MLTFDKIRKDKRILTYLKNTEKALKAIGYTEHGLVHAKLVAERAKKIAKEIGLSKKEQELSAIAGFCHDMGNFISRFHHHFWGALLFHQLFMNENPQDLVIVMQAIATHDKQREMKILNPVSACLVLADKSDVRRSRVIDTSPENLKRDIHARVNYGTTFNDLKINKQKKEITLYLKIDVNFVPVMEYFEIFTERMVYCREASKFLGYKFNLIINEFRLL